MKYKTDSFHLSNLACRFTLLTYENETGTAYLNRQNIKPFRHVTASLICCSDCSSFKMDLFM